MIVNKLKWVSSTNPEYKTELEVLNNKLIHFYSTIDGRNNYQSMIDETHDTESNFVSKAADKFADVIVANKIENILEFGCGSGKVYQQLKSKGYNGSYTGCEMADYVISDNALKMPEAKWYTKSIYDTSIESGSYDAVAAFFVLEHLVYPELALQNLLRIVKPNGFIFLIFPDIVASKILNSQKLGLNKLSGVKAKLKKRKILDAVITYFESISLRNNLKNLQKKYGNFVVNLDPICFEKNTAVSLIPDMDAVYIGSADEVVNWALKKGCSVEQPFRENSSFIWNPFIQIKKQ